MACAGLSCASVSHRMNPAVPSSQTQWSNTDDIWADLADHDLSSTTHGRSMMRLKPTVANCGVIDEDVAAIDLEAGVVGCERASRVLLNRGRGDLPSCLAWQRRETTRVRP
jgi:hypothetical protein